MTLDDGVRQAQLLWRLQRPEAALTRLVALRTGPRYRPQLLALLGDLAWRLEEHTLAAEAYGTLWKTQKRSEIGDRLIRSLDASGRRAEAVTIAAEAYDHLGTPTFLVIAADLALKSGNRSGAHNLFQKVEGKEKTFALESHFWFQRAQLAAHEGRASRRRAGLPARRAHRPARGGRPHRMAHPGGARAGPGHGPRAAATLGPRGRGQRRDLVAAGRRLRPAAATSPKAGASERMAREARARERAASGRPLTPDEQLEEAIERRDRPADRGPPAPPTATRLSLPMRVAALRELGRDEDAWACWRRPGMTDDKRLIGSEDAAAAGRPTCATCARTTCRAPGSGAAAVSWARSKCATPAPASSCARGTLLFGRSSRALPSWGRPRTQC